MKLSGFVCGTRGYIQYNPEDAGNKSDIGKGSRPEDGLMRDTDGDEAEETGHVSAKKTARSALADSETSTNIDNQR